MSDEELNSLKNQLDQSPVDWGMRIALIQAYVLRNEMDEAKKLVRESPDEAGPPPPGIQFRLHRMMTEGREAAEEFAREDGKFVITQAAEVEAEASQDSFSVPAAVEVMGNSQPHEAATVPSAKTVDLEEDFSGGGEALLGILLEEQEREVDEEEVMKGECIVVPSEKEDREAPLMKRGISKEKQWELDNSRFVIESADDFLPAEREPSAGRKVSAFSFAMLTHLVMIFLLTFIVIAVPRPNPPQIVAMNVAQDQLLDVPPTRSKEVKTPDRAAASAEATFVISSTALSTTVVPEFKETAMTDVAAYLTDVKSGIGMSLDGEAEESDVNFFGIQSGGRRIVFIIDATPTMLVDEKGGMFAYDKVKEEIGSMLASLNRGTLFNILLYEGKRMKVYSEDLVEARPSNLRLAIEWLDPLNRDYENLGLGRSADNITISSDIEPIASRDITGYAKAVQVAMEMEANTIFCIAGGYLTIGRAAPVAMNTQPQGDPPRVDPKDRAKWNQALQKTRDWLNKENEARQKKGLPPKVVVNFTALVRQVTGETPPRARGGSGGGNRPRPRPPYTPEEIEDHVKNLVSKYYREDDKPLPQLNMVLFLGKGEEIGDYKDHFRRLTRRNRGKLKMLEGLEALKDVTAGG